MTVRSSCCFVVALLVAVIGVGCGDDENPASSSTASPPAAQAGEKVFVVDANVKPQVEPTEMSNGNSPIIGLRWTGWGNKEATAEGTVTVRDCVPNCAEGGTQQQPVKVTLTGIDNCGERRLYLKGTLKFKGQEASEPYIEIVDCQRLADLRAENAAPEDDPEVEGGQSPLSDVAKPVPDGESALAPGIEDCPSKAPIADLRSNGIDCAVALETAQEAAESRLCKPGDHCQPTVGDPEGQSYQLNCRISDSARRREFACARVIAAAGAVTQTIGFAVQK